MARARKPGAMAPGGRTRSRLYWALAVVLLAAVVAAALRFSETREFVRLAKDAEPAWLILAVAGQAGTYWAQGEVFRRVARAGGARLRPATVYELALAKLFVDQAVPSAGVSGTAMLARSFEQIGLPRAVAAAAVAINLATYYAGYVLALAVALVIAALEGRSSAIVILVFALFVLISAALSASVLALSGRGSRAMPAVVARIRPLRDVLAFLRDADPRLARRPRTLLEALACQLAIVVLDAATMWVLIRSLGAVASPGGVFASFMISSLFRTIGIVPGGLGTFEASSVLTLKMIGVTLPVALAATLLFRGLSFWLPMLPGLWFSRRAVRKAR